MSLIQGPEVRFIPEGEGFFSTRKNYGKLYIKDGVLGAARLLHRREFGRIDELEEIFFTTSRQDEAVLRFTGSDPWRLHHPRPKADLLPFARAVEQEAGREIVKALFEVKL